GLVVADREQRGEELLARRARLALAREQRVEDVAVRDAPGGAEGVRRIVALLDELLPAVVREERLHRVERGVAAVEERRRVAARTEDARQRRDLVRLLALQDRLAGQRHERGQHALDAAHGAVAGRDELRQQQALLRPAV